MSRKNKERVVVTLTSDQKALLRKTKNDTGITKSNQLGILISKYHEKEFGSKEITQASSVLPTFTTTRQSN